LQSHCLKFIDLSAAQYFERGSLGYYSLSALSGVSLDASSFAEVTRGRTCRSCSASRWPAAGEAKRQNHNSPAATRSPISDHDGCCAAPLARLARAKKRRLSSRSLNFDCSPSRRSLL